MENSEYLQAFLDESEENLQVLNTICLRLEEGLAEAEDFAVMFRAAHTLKGMSATMGFEAMAHLTHVLEDVFGALKQNPQLLRGGVNNLLFRAIDALEESMASIRAKGVEEPTNEVVIGQLQEFLQPNSGQTGHAETAASVVTPIRLASKSPAFELAPPDETVQTVFEQCIQSGIQVGALHVMLDSKCQLKGARSVLVFREVERNADCIACTPPAEVMEAGEFDGPLIFYVALHGEDASLLEKAVSSVSEVEVATFSAWNVPSLGSSSNSSSNSSSEEAIRPNSQEAATSTQPVAKQRAAQVDQTVRVPIERLDHLMNLLSELVIDRTRLSSLAAKHADRAVKDTTDHLARVTTDLQSVMMSMRMVPVDNLFRRFPRMVRDLAKALDKDIRLDMSGLDTEIDRTVSEEMGEALVHLIRNAADHGLETAPQRTAAGKPPHGTLTLRAYASGQHVYVEVADDGRGVHVDKVKQRAVQRGLISDAEASRLSDGEATMLLFRPGFSTAEAVSDISGRGVGLDAVKDKVASLGGHVSIESTRGAGTTFRIQLPLTLLILQALLVEADEEVLAIPLGSVEEALLVQEKDLRRVHGQTVLNYREHLIPVVDVGEWLSGRPALENFPWRMVVCGEGSKRIALGVHNLLGQQEVVHRSLGQYLRQVPWFAGATILGDGKIALIIDVHAWLGIAGGQ